MAILMTEKMRDTFVASIEKMLDNVTGNGWEKPWKAIFTQGVPPQNMVTKGYYIPFNSFMLAMACDIHGWDVPYFVTYDKAKSMNLVQPCAYQSGQGEPLIMRNVRPTDKPDMVVDGYIIEKANPIVQRYRQYVYKDPDTGEVDYKQCLSWSKWNALPKAEQKNYVPVRRKRGEWVYNIEQTNFPDLYPEAWAQLKEAIKQQRDNKPDYHTDDVVVENIDKVLTEEGGWRCPIHFDGCDKAFWSLSKDEIHLPSLESFYKRSKYYSTALHEMAHSTSKATGRKVEGVFGSPAYAKEELVAELVAAMVSYHYGIEPTNDPDNPIDREHLEYIAGWRKSCKNPKEVIASIIDDVFEAVQFEITAIDYVDDRLEAYRKKQKQAA